MDHAQLRAKLHAIGQAKVLRFVERLDSPGRARFWSQITSQDLDLLAELVQTQVKTKAPVALPKKIEPVRAYPYKPDAANKELYTQAKARGEQLLREGKVGAFLVAGGQGTRLGYDGPKGEYPVTPVKNKPLFQVFAEQLRAVGRDYGKPVPWYIMTSEINDFPTRAFFERHKNFGLNPDDIFFFQQGMMPAFAMNGELLLAEQSSLALSPDGHGGSLRAIAKSGALADMKKRGVKHLSYFQVDNPLVRCVDPLFLGLHDLADSEMGSKTIPKANALEKVGNFCIGDGLLQVIEYSDLPESLAQEKNPDGSLKFNAGSIAIHALAVSFIERLNEGGKLNLPWHRAEKKVPFIDDKGDLVKPEKPNAVKLEQFVFDAIPLARNPIVYTTDRSEEFSPVKNAEGADSPATSRRDQIRRSARWLREAGVVVATQQSEPDCVIEISPLLATCAEQLKSRHLNKRQISNGETIYME